jgi:methylmalonyl-CoA mutase cobalamin-binding domain/chain
VFGGGVIPDADHEALKSSGIVMIFTPGTPLDQVTGWVQENVLERAQREGSN